MTDTLLVTKALGLVTLQAPPMRGRMHEGLSPGGPLAPGLVARANRRIDNAEDACAIEICGQLVVRAMCDAVVATDREVRELETGEEMSIVSGSRRVTYAAISGGVASSGTHLAAQIGALVRAGDRIRATPSAIGKRTHRELAPDTLVETVRILPGPDGDAFAADALDTLARTPWVITASSDRTGTRLDGAKLRRRPEYIEQTHPMVIGAIEVPRSGLPIVLGPEHPTTGGYPVIAVVATSDLDALHSIPLGGTVQFRVR